MASKYQKDIEGLKVGLTKIEVLLTNHLEHHQQAFNKLVKVYIPLGLFAGNVFLAILFNKNLGMLDFLKHAISNISSLFGG